jgi:hypothetical protein
MKRMILAATIVSAAALLLSCGASTTVKTMWSDSEYVPKTDPMNKVLIMGVYKTQSGALAFESEMKKQFAAKGVQAGGSMDNFKFDEQITKEALTQYVDANGYDAVLVSSVTDKETKVDYQPGYTYGGYGMGYHGYYGSSYGMVSSPGYMTSYDILHIESNLYRLDPDGEKLVWVGTSEVFDPEDVMETIKSFSTSIVPTLVSKGYFVRTK